MLMQRRCYHHGGCLSTEYRRVCFFLPFVKVPPTFLFLPLSFFLDSTLPPPPIQSLSLSLFSISPIFLNSPPAEQQQQSTLVLPVLLSFFFFFKRNSHLSVPNLFLPFFFFFHYQCYPKNEGKRKNNSRLISETISRKAFDKSHNSFLVLNFSIFFLFFPFKK